MVWSEYPIPETFGNLFCNVGIMVLDFEENVSNLLSFLDLKWEEELRNYHKTALSRGRISTPSASQVIKPLYQSASYRWKHYQEYIEEYRTRLAPWIQEYGYCS